MEYKYILSFISGIKEIKSIKMLVDDEADTVYEINGYGDYFRFNHYSKGDGFIYVEADFNDDVYFLLKDFDSLYRLADKLINDFNNNK